MLASDVARSAKVLVRAGAGYDNVDIAAAGSMGLPVCVVPDYGTEEVADATMSLLLAAARKTCYLAQKVKEGKWPTLESAGSKRYSNHPTACLRATSQHACSIS